jgi:hypothetical protein
LRFHSTSFEEWLVLAKESSPTKDRFVDALCFSSVYSNKTRTSFFVYYIDQGHGTAHSFQNEGGRIVEQCFSRSIWNRLIQAYAKHAGALQKASVVDKAKVAIVKENKPS